MKHSVPLLLFAAASTAFAQTQARVTVEVPDTELEAAHQANPDDTHLTERLVRYYSQNDRDSSYSARFALFSWNIEHHPDTRFFSNRESYGNMPKPMRDQLKQLWIVQVQQHPDNPAILRSAAIAMDQQPPAIRVGGNVQQTNLIRRVDPDYPALARQARIQGVVKFNATINPRGQIESLQQVSGHPLLVGAAQQAVQQWEYRPTLLNGSPITVITTIEIPFVLDSVVPNSPLLAR